MNHKKLLPQMIGLTLVMLLLVACAPPQPAPTPTPVPPTATPEPQPTPVPADQGTLVQDEITSPALADNLIGDPATRQFYIYLPPGYGASEKRYPVVYALHGFTTSAYIAATWNSYWKKIDRMIHDGDIGQMIVVFPEANNRFQNSEYLSSPTIGDYETYIVRDLVDHIDANYRTIAHRDSRAITGHSMGGEGAMRLALKYPEVFSVVAASAGMYNYDDEALKQAAVDDFYLDPNDFNELRRLGMYAQECFAVAAGAAPNPDKPPFFLDKPLERVEGQARIVPEVWQKLVQVDAMHHLDRYVSQPVQLRAILIVHGTADSLVPIGQSQVLDKAMTDLDIQHEYVENDLDHLSIDTTTLFQFLSDHLASETPVAP